MKLTTMKISMSVLMLMMFQSGHGARITAADWECFHSAATGVNAREVADHVFSEKSGFKVRNAEQASGALVDAINEGIQAFSPKGLVGNAEFARLVREAILGVNANDARRNVAANVQNALTDRIVAYFGDNVAAANGLWMAAGNNGNGIVDNIAGWANPVIEAFDHSRVFALGGDNHDEIDADLLGNAENPAEHTIRRFIADFNAAQDNDAARIAVWNALVDAAGHDGQMSGLSVNVNGDEVAGFVAKIRNAVNAQGEAGAPAREMAVYNLLLARAKEVRMQAFKRDGLTIDVVSDEEANTFVSGIGSNADINQQDLENGLRGILADRAFELRQDVNADDARRKAVANDVFKYFINRNVDAEATNPAKDAVSEFFACLGADNIQNRDARREAVQSAARRVLARNVESFLRPNMAQNMDDNAVAQLIQLVGIGAPLAAEARHNAVRGLAGTFSVEEAYRIVEYLRKFESLSNK